MLLQLVGEGRLSLDDPVSRRLPGVIAGNGNDGTRITVRQLLNHTAGPYDPTNEKSFWTPYLSGDRDFAYRPRDVVAMAVAHPPTGEPGARHDYSNTNYLVAGLIIEKVTGRSAVSQVYRRILVPLHLVDTRFPMTDPRMYGRHLRGYDLKYEDVTVWSPSYDWTAGAVVSTVDDLAKFYRALFDGTLLKPAQLAELKTTVPTDPGDSMAGYGPGGGAAEYAVSGRDGLDGCGVTPAVALVTTASHCPPRTTSDNWCWPRTRTTSPPSWNTGRRCRAWIRGH